MEVHLTQVALCSVNDPHDAPNTEGSNPQPGLKHSCTFPSKLYQIPTAASFGSCREPEN